MLAVALTVVLPALAVLAVVHAVRAVVGDRDGASGWAEKRGGEMAPRLRLYGA